MDILPKTLEAYEHLALNCSKKGDFEGATAYVQQLHTLRGWHQSKEKGYQFTTDWFTKHITNWECLLKGFVGYPGLNVLEVGSFEGMSTCYLLDHILTSETASITCIDIFETIFGNKYEHRFDFNISQTGAQNKVHKMVGQSKEILRTLSLESYDLIYIDGSHIATDVLQDAVLCWDLLKVGGILIFDDYKYETPIEKPSDAIDPFLAIFSSCMEILEKGWQVFLRKKSA